MDEVRLSVDRFCPAIQDGRQVQNDNTVRYKGLVLQIEQAHRRHFVIEYPGSAGEPACLGLMEEVSRGCPGRC